MLRETKKHDKQVKEAHKRISYEKFRRKTKEVAKNKKLKR